MKGRIALCCAAAALLAACQSKPAPETPKPKPAPVAAKPAPDIKGVKLGATQADVMALFPEAACEKVDAGTACTIYHVSYGGSESGVAFVAIADGGAKLIRIALLEEDKFDYMISGMVTKFGPPAEPSSPARLAHASDVGWGNDDWLLLAERVPKDMHSPQVTLVDRRWTEGNANAKAVEAAKSL